MVSGGYIEISELEGTEVQNHKIITNQALLAELALCKALWL